MKLARIILHIFPIIKLSVAGVALNKGGLHCLWTDIFRGLTSQRDTTSCTSASGTALSQHFRAAWWNCLDSSQKIKPSSNPAMHRGQEWICISLGIGLSKNIKRGPVVFNLPYSKTRSNPLQKKPSRFYQSYKNCSSHENLPVQILLTWLCPYP